VAVKLVDHNINIQSIACSEVLALHAASVIVPATRNTVCRLPHCSVST